MKQFLKNFRALRLVKQGAKQAFSLEELESKHHQQGVDNYSDSMYFAGISADGLTFVTRMSFRNRKLNENWLKVYIPDEGVWGFENRGMIEGKGFEQGKLKYICLEPGESWHLQFEGQLFQGKKYYQAVVDLHWKSLQPIVNFEKDGLSADKLAFQIASQEWGRGFCKHLKALKKKHYEQAGEITGTITWKRKKHKVAMKAIRYHSFGKHNWKDWRRHFWFSGLLSDGRMIHIGVVDFSFVKALKSGYVSDGEKVRTLYETPSFSALKFSDDTSPVLSFGLISEKGEALKEIRLELQQFFSFDMNKEYAIRQAKTAFEYEGVKGVGIAEMGLQLDEKNEQIDFISIAGSF